MITTEQILVFRSSIKGVYTLRRDTAAAPMSLKQPLAKATKSRSILLIQLGLEPQKTVKFSHSIISLNQLLKNFKNTANIFLTFRNHVKIFLSRNIMHNF